MDQATRSGIMRSIRGKDTKPELLVRSALHRLGYRFRIHCRKLPGSPDIVLKRFGAVIFANGCFWHWHGCGKGNLPKTRLDYWLPKLAANRERDRRNSELLANAGWRVLTIWECELKDRESLERRLLDFLERREPFPRMPQ